MATEAQLLELEKIGGLTPKEQEAVNQLRDLRQFPPPITVQSGAQQVADSARAAAGTAAPIAPPAPLATPYDTQLNAPEESKFQAWKQQYAPSDSGADYDLRGAFKAGLTPDPKTGHWPDTFKKPNHPTFSDQSQYASAAPEKAGHWEGDKFIPPAAAAVAPAPVEPQQPGVVGHVAGEALFQTVLRPAADLNRLGYAIIGEKGGIFDTPEKYKARRIEGGLYGATRLPAEHLKEDLPHHFLEWLGAGGPSNPTATVDFLGQQGGAEAISTAASPLEGALLTTGPGRAIWGLGVAARTVSGGADALADAVEGVAGITVLGRDLWKAGKLLKQGMGPVTAAEKEYVASKAATKEAAGTAEKAQQAVEALKVRVGQAREQAGAVAASAEAIARENVTAAVKEHEAAIEHLGHLDAQTEVPVADLGAKMGLTAEGPRAKQAGEMLRAIGEDAKALSPAGVEEVGVPAEIQRLAKTRRGLYQAFESQADELGAHLPAGGTDQSAGAALIRRRSGQYLRALIDGTGSTAEKAVAREFSLLGVIGLTDPATGAMIPTKGMTPAAIRKLKLEHPGLQFEYEDVPLSALSQLYARGRTIGLSPREYPVSSNQAKKAYSRLMSSVKGSMHAVASGDPALHESLLTADRFVRKVEKPFIRETAYKVLSPGKTPRQAFDLLMADDPTTIERVFTHASSGEREAYAHAIFSELMNDVTNEAGQVDRVALAKSFRNLPSRTQELLASFGNGAAKMVVDEALVHRQALMSAAENVTAKAAAVRGIKEKRVMLLSGVKSAQQQYLLRAKKELQAALDTAGEVQQRAERLSKYTEDLAKLPRQSSQKVLDYIRANDQLPPIAHAGSTSRMFGKAHGIMALVDFAHGNLLRGVIQTGEAAFFLKRNRIVREALETPIDSPRGRELAAALHAIGQWRLGPQFSTPARRESR